jgi:acetyltransferase-like isoleucine patch superfamily enzyme
MQGSNTRIGTFVPLFTGPPWLPNDPVSHAAGAVTHPDARRRLEYHNAPAET